MKCKKLVIRFVIPVLIVIAAVLTVLFAQNGKHAKIDEWSSTLVAERVEWAEVAKGYGTGQCSYEISTGEYSELVSLLETVKEESSFRKRPIDALENDYYLAFRYDQKLWLFQCVDNGSIHLSFEDDETAAHYGCEKSALYINSPELWEYIISTVDSKATY